MVAIMRAHSFAALIGCGISLISGVVAGLIPREAQCLGTECAPGYVCNPETISCIKADSSYYQSLRKRQSVQYTPVTGASGTGVVQRQNVQDMQRNNPDQFMMYMAALSSMQSVSESSTSSYYQISGIHGRPYIPYQEAVSSSQNPTTGYCTHSSALFPTWHRPYLALLEQHIVATAIAIANNYPAGSTRNRWLSAAQKVRLPYWDWATPDLQSGLPPICMQPKFTVTIPVNGVATQRVIPNPLYQYAFLSQGLKNQYFDGWYVNAAATRRNPTDSGKASQNSVSDQAMRNSYQSRRQSTYNLFSMPSFGAFSNTQFSAGNAPGSFNSVEAIHNEIHVNCGGTGNDLGNLGHMSVLDYSAFDPIFWLHHCQIDRLVAMFQAINPNMQMTSEPASSTFARVARQGSMDTDTTPLNPFRHTNGQYYTSRDVMPASSIWDLNYSYAEVPYSYKGQPASALRSYTTSRMNALYRPSPSGTTKRDLSVQPGVMTREWISHIVLNPQECTATTEVMIFCGNYTSNGHDTKTDPTYVGSGVAFKKAQLSNVPPQHGAPPAPENVYITATVSLTAALVSAGIDVTDAVACVKYLKSYLHWSLTMGSVSTPTTQLPSLLVGVSSRNVTYGGGDQLPVNGIYETYYECTAGKVGGLTIMNNDVVKSVDVVDLLGDTVITKPPTPLSGYDATSLGSGKKQRLQSMKMQIAKEAGAPAIVVPNSSGSDLKIGNKTISNKDGSAIATTEKDYMKGNYKEVAGVTEDTNPVMKGNYKEDTNPVMKAGCCPETG